MAHKYLKHYFKTYYVQQWKPNEEFPVVDWPFKVDNGKAHVVILCKSVLRDFRGISYQELYDKADFAACALWKIQKYCEVWILEDVLLAIELIKNLIALDDEYINNNSTFMSPDLSQLSILHPNEKDELTLGFISEMEKILDNELLSLDESTQAMRMLANKVVPEPIQKQSQDSN